MAGNRSCADYGAPYVDQEAVSNPETQMSANKGNRLMEDVAQMTRVSKKVDVVFTTSSTAAPVSVTPTSGKSQWGTGSSYLPTVSKTATGQYTITWQTSYADALDGTVADAASETETLALTRARVTLMTNTSGYARAVPSGSNAVTLFVKNSSHADSDLLGVVSVWVEAE
jgi:hypothetical protein